MKKVRQAPGIIFTLTLSALLHIILLSTSLIEFPPAKTLLPPLTAHLAPLPKIAAKPTPPRKTRKPRPPLPVSSAPEETPLNKQSAPDNPSETPPDLAAPPPQEEALTGVDTQAIPQISPVEDTPNQAVETATPVHHFPKQAQLTFVVYKGKDFKVGEVRHSLQISDDKSYLLKVGVNTTGIASIFKPYELNQQSSGIITDQGMRPGKFTETKNTSSGKETSEATFVWDEKLLTFLNGNSTPLSEHSQDIISFLYQLPLLSLNKGEILIHITNGRKLERYQLAVGDEELIQTSLGRLRALHLHKLHAPGEEGMDIWLGLEYKLLPIKISMVDRNEQVSGEMVIAEILVAEN